MTRLCNLMLVYCERELVWVHHLQGSTNRLLRKVSVKANMFGCYVNIALEKYALQ